MYCVFEHMWVHIHVKVQSISLYYSPMYLPKPRGVTSLTGQLALRILFTPPM